MAERSAPPFTPGDRTTLLCVGHQLDVLHARLPERGASEAQDLSARDARAVPRGRSFIVRTGLSRDLPVAGEWFELTVERAWRFGGGNYLKGEVTRCWLDLEALALPALDLLYEGPWTVAGWLRDSGLEPDDLEPAYEAVLAAHERREVEMERVSPEPLSRLELEEDAILESIAWRDMGDPMHAEKLLSELLRQDLRCVDAHAHLGNLHMEGYWGRPRPERARRHYQVGVAIAESALAPDGNDVTPKGLIDNRPYLRALHGLGLAAWALGDNEEAERLFARLLWRDPSDGAGARFLLEDLRRGARYEEAGP